MMTGLALEGGGAKGSYHSGAVKALYESGLFFNAVAGTSIGAINGAILAQGDPQLLFSWWEELVPSHLFDEEDSYIRNAFLKKYDRETIKHLLRFATRGIANGGFPIAGFKKLIEGIIDEDKVRSSEIDYGLVTYSLTDKTPIEAFKDEIPYGFLHEYIMASAYFPAFKINPMYGKKKYVDGGVYNNLPINPLIRRGCEEVYAVRTNSNMPSIAVIDDTVKVHYINPSAGIGSTFSFTPGRVAENIKMGYHDAIRTIRRYNGNYCYLIPMGKALFNEFINSISDKAVSLLKERLGSEYDKSGVLNKFFAVVRKQLSLSRAVSDEEAFIMLIEKFISKTSFDRYRIFSLPDLLCAISGFYSEKPAKEILFTDRLSADLYYIIVKNFKD